jgi:short-subunit dehydrogenase
MSKSATESPAATLTPARPTALVTGASGGIGADIAELLAKRGHDLVLVARSRDKLAALAEKLEKATGIHVTVLTADLTDPAAPESIAKFVDDKGIHVDVLVNNAGLGSYGPFAEIDAKTDLGLIALNITSLTHMSKLFLPKMLANKRGRIMNVGSTAGFVPGPLMAVYYASKAYVLSLSVALANEVRGSGVTVTCLCPGATRTAFDTTAGNDKTRLFKGSVMESMPVALAGVEAMLAGDVICIPGFMNRLMASTTGLAPRTLLAKIARTYQEPAST